MTDTELKLLKRMLKRSSVTDSDDKFDQRILHTAKLTKTESLSFRQGLFEFAPIFAALSLIIGIPIFLVLDANQRSEEAISIAKLSTANTPTDDIQIELDIRSKRPAQSKDKPKRPFMAQEGRPETNLARDLKLLDAPIPALSDLIAAIDMPSGVDEIQLQKNIEIALDDIQVLLNQGLIQHARERYVMLVITCPDCELPGTLDSLLLSDDPDRGMGMFRKPWSSTMG